MFSSTWLSIMQLEFVNISGAEPWKNKEAKKLVRSRAMKDFRRRQRESAAKLLIGKSSRNGYLHLLERAVMLMTWKLRWRSLSQLLIPMTMLIG